MQHAFYSAEAIADGRGQGQDYHFVRSGSTQLFGISLENSAPARQFASVPPNGWTTIMSFFDRADDFIQEKSAWIEITDGKNVSVTVSVEFTSALYKGWTKPGVLTTPGPLSATSWGECQSLIAGLKLSDRNSGWAVLAGIPTAPLFSVFTPSHGYGYCDSKGGALSSGQIKWQILRVHNSQNSNGHGELK